MAQPGPAVTMASAGSAAVDAYSRPADHRRGFPSAATRRRQLADNCRGGAPAARRRLAGGSQAAVTRWRVVAVGRCGEANVTVTATGCATSCVAHPSCILPSCIVWCLGSYIISVHSDWRRGPGSQPHHNSSSRPITDQSINVCSGCTAKEEQIRPH